MLPFMSIRFAGSRCVDERRRRRLAQEADGLPVDGDARSASRDASAGIDDENTDELSRRRGDAPADSLISPRLWKHVSLCVFLACVWGVILYFGERTDRLASGMRHIVGLEAGKLAKFFSTVMLLAAGQLSFISLWYRSRSRKDFKGSYKVWLWSALGWLTLCACRATGVHWNLADAVIQGHHLEIWSIQTMVWMVPAAVIVSALYRLLLREMRDCAASRWLMRLSVVAAIASAVSVIVEPFVADAQLALLVRVGTTTLWHLLLAQAMLLHARYVIHFNNEPPSSPLRSWKLRLPKIRHPKRKPKAPKAKQEKNEKPKSKPALKKTTAARKTSAKPSKRKTTKRKAHPKPELVDKPTPEAIEPELEDEPIKEAPAPTRKSPPQRRVDELAEQAVPEPKADFSRQKSNTRRAPQANSDDWDDEPLDPAMLQGLSKKERRRLRKQHRDRQRTAKRR